MFKIDWPCAVGGVVLGYYTKAKVESTKTQFKRISTDALDSIKRSLGNDSQPTQPDSQAGQGKNG